MNRRNFLKAFTKVAVGAAVLAATPAPIQKFLEAAQKKEIIHGNVLTYKMFCEISEKMTLRALQPNPMIIICSPAQHAAMKRLGWDHHYEEEL